MVKNLQKTNPITESILSVLKTGPDSGLKRIWKKCIKDLNIEETDKIIRENE